MTSSCSVVATVAGEPWERLDGMIESIRRQEGVTDLELVIAAPPDELRAFPIVAPGGAIAAVRLVPNPGGGRSEGLNRAIEAAAGGVIVRVDARSRVGPDHVGRALDALARRPEIGVVGGVQRPRPETAGVIARGIARALANPWLLGGAAYRRGGRSGPADTVYLGAFRREELRALGGYREDLVANEDFELCQRYRAAGLLVWLDAQDEVEYLARGTLAGVARQYADFGRAKVDYWTVTGAAPNGRQLVALAGGSSSVAAAAIALRRPRLLAVLGTSVVGAVAAVDRAAMGPAPSSERLAAVLTYPVVCGSWLLGVLRGVMVARRSPASAPGRPSPTAWSRRRPRSG